MGGYLVYCVVCTVTDFSAAERDRGMKFCTRIGLLSRQVFSPFGELWLAGSHGGGISLQINIGIGSRHSNLYGSSYRDRSGAFGIGGSGIA